MSFLRVLGLGVCKLYELNFRLYVGMANLVGFNNLADYFDVGARGWRKVAEQGLDYLFSAENMYAIMEADAKLTRSLEKRARAYNTKVARQVAICLGEIGELAENMVIWVDAQTSAAGDA